MGFFKRKEKDKPAGGEAAEEATAPVPQAPSATHLALIAERETSALAHRRAQKAETRYRRSKKATIARAEYAAAKTHIKATFTECRAGMKSSCKFMWLSHAILLEKMGRAETKKEKKAIERTQSKRVKLSEKMKKMEEEEERRKKEAPAAEEEAAAAAA